MNLEEQAQARLAGIEFPSDVRREQDLLLPGSGERTAPLPETTSVLESIAAGVYKSSTVQAIEAIKDPEPFYFPDDTDLTQHPELVEGIPLEKQSLILGQVSLGAAKSKRNEILDRMELDRVQYANGAAVGFGAEILGYIDPVGVAGGMGINTVMKVPAAYRAGKTAARLWGAASVGGLTFVEETLRNQRAGVSGDDVLYATAGAMAVGGALGNVLMKANADDAVDKILIHADEQAKNLGKELQVELDNAKAVHPEYDTQSMRIPDEHYDIVGEGVELTDEMKEAGKAASLTENFSEIEYKIAQRAEELVANGEVTDLKEMGNILKLIEKNPIMSDGVRAALSKSPVAQVISAHLGEIATGTRGKIATTAAMHKNQLERQILMQINPVLKNSQVEYLSRRGIKQWNPFKFHGSGKREFDEALKYELALRNAGRKAAEVADPAITKAADAWDVATKRVLQELKNAGWKGAEDVQWKPGYFQLIWSGEAISKLKTAGKLADGKKALTIAYTDMGFSDELSSKLADAVINRALSNGADIEFNPATLFTKSGRGDLERMLVEAKVSDMDRRGIMKLVERDTSNGMHQRTDINLTAEYGGVRVLDMTQSDMSNLMSRWVQRNSGMVGLAKKGVTNFDMIDSFKKLARTQAASHGEDVQKLGHSVDAIFDTLLAKPVYLGVSRNVRRVMDWSLVTKLGQIGFAQTAEMSNISAAHGLYQSIKSIPEANKIYRQLIKAMKSGDWSGIDKEFMGELQGWGGSMIDEHLLFRPSVRLDETVDSGWAGVADNIQAVAVDALGTYSGMYRIKGIEQTLVTMLQAQKVAKLMKGKITKAKGLRLGELGWGDETITRIQKQFKEHATYDKKVLDRLNLEHWDADARAEFLQGMHRHVNHAIQLPMAGEGTYWMHQNTAALLLQFRGFPMLAIEKQTGRHLMASDQEAAAAFMYGLAWSSVAGMVKTYTNAIGRSDRDDYLKRRLTPSALAMQAMNYSSSLSMLGDAVGVVGGIAGMPIDGYYGGVAPALDGAYRAAKGVAGVVGGVNPLSEHKATERDMRNLMSAVPLGNTIQATVISNQLLKSVFNKEK